jgi:arylsulfatase A-like enzyme
VLQNAGYTTGFVSDVYHQFKPGKNFHRGFDSWRYIRGQEQDRLELGPKKAIRISNYLHASQTGHRGMRNGPLQYLLNRRHWHTEDDWHAAQVFREAARWLDIVHEEGQPFYLHIESFSPHEYWDPPEDYYRMYMKGNYSGPRLIAPPGTTKDMTPVEVEHVRALYGGLVTFTDACIGKFLRRVEMLGLMKNTLVVFVSDHGTMMGEQGQLHKGDQRLRRQVTQVPLAIYHPSVADKPSWAGRRIRGFVQHTDLMPTLLDVAGVKAPPRVTGESLKALQDSRRDSVITGWGDYGSVRTPEWNYVGRWNSSVPPFEELYHLSEDPAELENVAAKHPAVISDLRAKLKAHVDGGWAITRGSFARIG